VNELKVDLIVFEKLPKKSLLSEAVVQNNAGKYQVSYGIYFHSNLLGLAVHL